MNSTTLDFSQLQQRVSLLGQLYDLADDWLQNNPNLFSNTVITIPTTTDQSIKSLIYAIEQVVNMPAYQQAAFRLAGQTQPYNPGTPGVFLSYDFHLSESGPKLIEINTNAGGSCFATLLQLAVISIMDGEEAIKQPWEERIIAMFLNEWHLKRGQQTLKRIAIVDHNPTTQHFYPEFLIFKTLFQSHGIDAIIVDPSELSLQNNQLTHNGLSIDLVYNRLTDFLLEEDQHLVLRQAYENDEVVLTPHPYAYLTYANKMNLILLSDRDLLKSWGIPDNMLEILANGIPQTIKVNPEQSAELWAKRKQLFFKPASSFGGKGAFRGSKLTRGTFESIINQNYVAQTFIPPTDLAITSEEQALSLKMDLRYYMYQNQELNKIARLYEGQTTNFRTRGGGFAMLGISG